MPQVAPTDLFVDYAVVDSDVVIPLTSLPALNATEANATTGNGMEVLRAVVTEAYNAISTLPEQEKPTKAVIVKQPVKFLANGNYQVTFLLNFELAFDDNSAVMASE